jgi:hypothetical protein
MHIDAESSLSEPEPSIQIGEPSHNEPNSDINISPISSSSRLPKKIQSIKNQKNTSGSTANNTHHKFIFSSKFWKLALFLVGIPLLIFIASILTRRSVHSRISRFLDIENRLFREKYGCAWSINKCMTELTLKQVGQPSRAQGYPTPLPTHPFQTYTEENQAINNSRVRPFEGVSHDDSSSNIAYH